jgi:hypothetical protein
MKALKKLAGIGAIVGSAVLPFTAKAAAGLNLGLNNVGSAGLGSQDIRTTIGAIINVALSFIGVIVLCIILYGGFLWMTAGGNEEKVGEAKKWIYGGIIGLVIILSSYAIAQFVINSLVTATTTGATG